MENTNKKGRIVDLIALPVGDRVEDIKEAIRQVHEKAPINGYTRSLMRSVENKYNPNTSQLIIESDINSLIIVASETATDVNKSLLSRAVATVVLSLVFEQDILAEYYYMYYEDLIKALEFRAAVLEMV